jgi:hypothetical protein
MRNEIKEFLPSIRAAEVDLEITILKEREIDSIGCKILVEMLNNLRVIKGMLENGNIQHIDIARKFVKKIRNHLKLNQDSENGR